MLQNGLYQEAGVNITIRLLKNIHLLRCAHPSSLRRTVEYASFLLISRALHLDVFDQPGGELLFQQPAMQPVRRTGAYGCCPVCFSHES